MHDPWDVKSVRQSGQYMSCMKINGVPLLPPILSKECRKEMQYYKLLAKEVEKRIHALKSFVVESDTESNTDKTYAPDLPESEQSSEILIEDPKLELDVEIYKDSPMSPEKNINNPIECSIFNNTNSTFDNIATNFTTDTDSTLSKLSSKFVLDLSLSLNDSSRRQCDSVNFQANDLPERDCNCLNNRKRELLTDVECNIQKQVVEGKESYTLRINKKALTDPITNQDGPSSLGSKSFTGSLNNLHVESLKQPPLIRQRSYTVLKPCPMLLAHLEVQSLNRGVDVKSISMSESLSNLSSSNKKRRSWDLESAKVKWSSMALELKGKNITKNLKRSNTVKPNMNATQKTPIQNTTPKAKSVIQEKVKPSPTKILNKSDPIQKPHKTLSPVRNSSAKNAPKNTSISEPRVIEENSKQSRESRVQNENNPVLEVDDPATRVRELYEKIQKQQIIQMANLVEKQKREQMLLQQVFEEQNNLLFTQLKNICPKSPLEVKEAFTENEVVNRGPVSLSQLINQKPPEDMDSPVFTTLTETNNYLNHCDNVLRKSRDISSGLKQNPVSRHAQGEARSPKPTNGSRTRTQSPNARNTATSRRLTYETSMSSERDYEPVLTDRTNDTLADLNVTFTSDNTEEYEMLSHNVGSNLNGTQSVSSPIPSATEDYSRSTDSAIRSMEKTIQNSIKSMSGARSMKSNVIYQPTVKEITAACYTLHDTFVASSPAERCAIISADRHRKRMLATRPPFRHYKSTDLMSQSHSGVFPTRPKRASPSLMTQSNYETFSGERTRRYVQSPRRRPWR